MIIWVKCMYVYKVWMNVREFWSVQALYVTTNALYWKFLEMQNSMQLTLLKHQNTKTSLYELSKNHWVITLLGIFGYDIRNLQFIVSLDHPVVSHIFPPFLLGLLSSIIMGFFVSFQSILFIIVVTFSSFLSFSEKEFQSRQEGNLF